jgi:hypothetical protein
MNVSCGLFFLMSVRERNACQQSEVIQSTPPHLVRLASIENGKRKIGRREPIHRSPKIY